MSGLPFARPQRILVVEDDELLSSALKQGLEAAGYDVMAAGNGKQAIRLYLQNSFDLVLADIFMPDMDGLELIGALRKNDPKLRIIAMSGGGLFQPDACLRAAELMGATGTLTKPFKLSDLVRMVEGEAGKFAQ